MIVGTQPNPDRPAAETRSATDQRAAPRVSVIIPARNAELTIAAQLAAVCGQAAPTPFEVLVVDNGSGDGTIDVVRRLAAIHHQIRLISGPRAPNRSAARNLGAAEAHGEVLLFCDADDVVDAGWLSKLVGAIEQHDVVTGGLLAVDHETGRASPTARVFQSEFRGLPCLASGNFAIRRATFDALGGFSEAIRHRVDIELSCRLHVHGTEVHFEPGAVVRYVRRANLLGETRQHFWWGVADVQIRKLYRDQISFRYSWKNSVKKWLTVVPSLLRAILSRRDARGPIITLAALSGRLVGSVRHRTWAI